MEEKLNRRYIKWAAGIVLALCILGIGGILIANKQRYSPRQFDAFVEEIFLEEAGENTINLHYVLAYPENYGISGYEATLGNYSVEELKKANEELEELEKELEKFDTSDFSREQRLTYDILLDYAKTELSAKDFLFFGELLSPTTGYQAQLPVVLAEYTFRTKQDIEDYLALAAQIDEMAEEVIAFEKEKAEAGFFMPDYAADAVIGQCSEFIAQPEENYMIEVFNDKIDSFEGLSDEERESYKERNHTIITTEVTAGYQTLIDGLGSLKGSGKNELGLCYYDEGKEYYKYLVRTSTGSGDSVRELQKRTEKFMKDYFQKVQKAILKDVEIYDRLVSYQFPDMEPEEILAQAAEKIKEDFPEPPEVGYTVKYVHPSMQENLSPAFYLVTPIDDIQNNLIYINEKYLDPANEAQMSLYPTLIHEGYPGHLYQNVYTASCNLPLIRNLLSYLGYSEGWATYVEFEYGYDFAIGDETLAELLSQSQMFSLAVYAYIDMGIHYDGWDRAEVEDYLAQLGIVGSGYADEIFETLVEEPANYLSYFIGCLEFMDLREKAEEELGEAFDVKEFHQFLLKTGPAPFYIIEDYMEEWMEEQ